MSTALLTSLILTCAAAVWFDVRERRVPNVVTVGALAVAVAIRSVGGWDPLLQGVGAAGLALALSLPLFAMGALGGGDAKLLTGVAALLGLDRLLPALVFTAFAGGALALLVMIRHRACRETWDGLRLLWLSRGTVRPGPGGESALAERPTAGGATLPYAVAIAAGALIGWWW